LFPSAGRGGEQLLVLEWTGPCDGLHVDGLDGRRFASAVFARVDGQWRCVRACPQLAWWLRVPAANVYEFLEGPARLRGWRWRWARCFEV